MIGLSQIKDWGICEPLVRNNPIIKRKPLNMTKKNTPKME